MNSPIRIGIIGLDTSHVAAFSELLNTSSHAFHVKGGLVTAAYPGGSADFERSHKRVPVFAEQLKDKYGVEIVETPEAVAGICDAILLESADGRVHLDQFRKIAPYGKPTFIDKPLAVSSGDARSIVQLAEKFKVPLMSASALRYADALTSILGDDAKDTIFGADFFGPMEFEITQPGLFWYGIHIAEMLYAALGKGCFRVTVSTHDNFDVVTGMWRDGRAGSIRSSRPGGHFGGVIHRSKGPRFVDVDSSPKPFYASLLEHVIAMFQRGVSPIDMDETLEIIRFIEAANESRTTGKSVDL